MVQTDATGPQLHRDLLRQDLKWGVGLDWTPLAALYLGLHFGAPTRRTSWLEALTGPARAR